MTNDPPTLWLDAVDPVSWLVERELRVAEADTGVTVRRMPVELRPAPAPLTDAQDPVWAPRWEEAERLVAEGAVAPGARPTRPGLIPRSGKAHELFLHAQANGCGPEVLEAVFTSFLVEGRDIGRIDVLVEIARWAGLDLTESKAVLDVDKYAQATADAAAAALAAGVADAPCLTVGGERLQGFHNHAAIGTLLARSQDHLKG